MLFTQHQHLPICLPWQQLQGFHGFCFVKLTMKVITCQIDFLILVAWWVLLSYDNSCVHWELMSIPFWTWENSIFFKHKTLCDQVHIHVLSYDYLPISYSWYNFFFRHYQFRLSILVLWVLLGRPISYSVVAWGSVFSYPCWLRNIWPSLYWLSALDRYTGHLAGHPG